MNLRIILLCTVITFCSCTEKINLTFKNGEPKVVIYGELTDSLVNQTIKISTSTPFIGEKVDAHLTGVDLHVIASDGAKYLFKEDDTKPGVYRSVEKFAAKVGISYTLTAQIDNDNDGLMNIYTASTTLLPAYVIDSVKIEKQKMIGKNIYLLKMYAPSLPRNSYVLVNYMVNGKLVTEAISRSLIFESKLMADKYIKGFPLLSTDFDNNFYDESENNPDDKSEKKPFYVKQGDRITVLFSNITKDDSDFRSQCKRFLKAENPMFGGSNSNITTNLSGGAVGYFSSHTVVPIDVIVP